MNPIVRNILVVLGALVVGNVVNMALVMASPHVIPYPEGVDASNMNSIISNIDKFGFEHFIMPFLAHALGTLVAAFVAAKFVTTKPMIFALSIGGFFFIMGIINSLMISHPITFAIIDAIFAYVPMGWLGYKLAAPKE